MLWYALQPERGELHPQRRDHVPRRVQDAQRGELQLAILPPRQFSIITTITQPLPVVSIIISSSIISSIIHMCTCITPAAEAVDADQPIPRDVEDLDVLFYVHYLYACLCLRSTSDFQLLLLRFYVILSVCLRWGPRCACGWGRGAGGRPRGPPASRGRTSLLRSNHNNHYLHIYIYMYTKHTFIYV